MKNFILLLICILGVNLTFAQIKAVTETGEEVLLYPYGTWEYLNNSDIADTDIPTNPKLFKKEDASTFLVKSNIMNIGVWINPKEWSFEKSKDNSDFEYNFQLKGGSLYGAIITEKIEIPLLTLKSLAVENAKKVAPDMRIVKEEYRNVNGLNVLLLKMDGTTQGVKFTYYGYYYSNSKGTVQFITYTSQNLMDEYLLKCEKLLNGLVEIH